MKNKRQLKSIKLNKDELSLPKDFAWKDIQPFSLITGLNGVGKTHLLEAIFQYSSGTHSLMPEGSPLDLAFCGDPNEKETDERKGNTWNFRDVHYTRYNETLLSQLVHHEHFLYFGHVKGYKECIVLLFLRAEVLPSDKQCKGIIEGLFPQLTADKDNYVNGQSLADQAGLVQTVESISALINEEKKTKIVKREIKGIIDIYSDLQFRDLSNPILHKNQQQFVDDIYKCLEVYLPAICFFKQCIGDRGHDRYAIYSGARRDPGSKQPVFDHSEEPLRKMYEGEYQRKMQTLLDAWFWVFCKNRQDCILEAFERAQKQNEETLSARDTLSRLPTAPWDLLNQKIEEYGKPYGFKHKIKAPDTNTTDLSSIQCAFENEDGITFPFDKLSSGEKIIFQILLITCQRYILGYLPKCLLLDEPDSHLHPSLAKVLVRMLNEIIVEGMGIQVIMTTHQATTVALAPVGSIFEMQRKDETVTILPIDQSKAVDTLTDGLLAVVPKDHKLVFTEDMPDAHFYQKMFERAQSKGLLSSKVQLYFITAGQASGGSHRSGGCAQAREMVNRLRLGKTHFDPRYKVTPINHSSTYGTIAPQKHFILGLIDKDVKKNSDKNVCDETAKGIYKLHRCELENMECDAFFIVWGLMEKLGAGLKETAINGYQIQEYVERFYTIFYTWLEAHGCEERTQDIQNTSKKQKESSQGVQLYVFQVKASAEALRCFITGESEETNAIFSYFHSNNSIEVGPNHADKKHPVKGLFSEFWESWLHKNIDNSKPKHALKYISMADKSRELEINVPHYWVHSKGKLLKAVLGSFIKLFDLKKNDPTGSSSAKKLPKEDLVKRLFNAGLESSGYFPSDLLAVFQAMQDDGRSPDFAERNEYPDSGGEHAFTGVLRKKRKSEDAVDAEALLVDVAEKCLEAGYAFADEKKWALAEQKFPQGARELERIPAHRKTEEINECIRNLEGAVQGMSKIRNDGCSKSPKP